MFNFLNKLKKDTVYELVSPIKGKVVSLKEVNDPTFSEGLLGDGVAFIPYDGKICAPCDGRIEILFDTLHAVNIISDVGVEVLIHSGLDTVKLNGEGFKSYVHQGDKVKKGDLLLTVDYDKLKSNGFDIITPMIICNSNDYLSITSNTNIDVNIGDDVIKIKYK